jgi:hypothetical protein
MSTHLVARSVARPVQALLQPWALNARVLATFAHVCDLVTAAGEVLALVDPEVGDGPLNLVVQAAAPAWEDREPVSVLEALSSPKPGMPVQLEGSALLVGDLVVALEGAATWEPRPDWEALRARRVPMAGPLQRLRELALAQSPEESLLHLMQETATTTRESARAAQAAARAAAAVLRAGWAGDVACLREGVAWLAGLGGGLTPAGDDFLCGVMLAAWLAHPDPDEFCLEVIQVAVPRTTLLSAAFLRAAGRGECSAAWHRLLPTLAADNRGEIAAAVQAVLARGATSGADALAGFVTGCLYGLSNG